ncbi:MAG TPA: hypothetical protein VL859_02690, partial [Flavobacterium sp.]|nr:hypothetical protein [Flavobacterium sp.]
MFSIFDLSLQLNAFPIRKAKSDLDKIVALSPSEKKQFIENQKQAIVEFHLENNAFYQKLVGSKDYKNWEDLPILNKTNLQCPLEYRLSKGFTTKNSYINKTSGSSGEPFIFAKDKYAHALTWASNMYRF